MTTMTEDESALLAAFDHMRETRRALEAEREALNQRIATRDAELMTAARALQIEREEVSAFRASANRLEGVVKVLADTLELLKNGRVQLLADERAAIDAALRTAGRML